MEKEYPGFPDEECEPGSVPRFQVTRMSVCPVAHLESQCMF